MLCDVAVQKSESFVAEADGLLAVSSTQLFGALSVCNTGVGRCLARFSLSAAARTALGATNKVVSMTLALRRAETDANCGGSCASLRQAGLLTVVPARVDWVESQMNWDVLKTSSNWGVAGAGQVGTDIGDVAGSLSILATDLAPKVSLDPAKWTPTFLPTSQVAVRYELLDGANRRQFVSVSHEVGALPHEPPKLTLTYCP